MAFRIETFQKLFYKLSKKSEYIRIFKNFLLKSDETQILFHLFLKNKAYATDLSKESFLTIILQLP